MKNNKDRENNVDIIIAKVDSLIKLIEESDCPECNMKHTIVRLATAIDSEHHHLALGILEGAKSDIIKLYDSINDEEDEDDDEDDDKIDTYEECDEEFM